MTDDNKLERKVLAGLSACKSDPMDIRACQEAGCPYLHDERGCLVGLMTDAEEVIRCQ